MVPASGLQPLASSSVDHKCSKSRLRQFQQDDHLLQFYCGLIVSSAGPSQVYKALRGGVQDVAVKVLLCSDEEQLLQFEKVRKQSPARYASISRSWEAQCSELLCRLTVLKVFPSSK